MDIKLKQWTSQDARQLSDMCNAIDRRYLSDRIPNPYTEKDADWYLNMISEQEGKSGVFRKIIVDDIIIGAISVEQKQDVFRKDAEIGYYLLPQWYRKGIMSAAVKQICEIAFQTLDLIRISGVVYEPNIASRKVLENNGFVLEGMMKQAVVKDDAVYHLYLYGKLKSAS